MKHSLQNTVILTNKLGLHTRAASAFVQVASTFQSKIQLKKPNNSNWVNGKSILSIMTLEAICGCQIIISVKGTDATRALKKLTKLVNDKFGEKE